MTDRIYLHNQLTRFLTTNTIISLFYCDLNERFHSYRERHDFWEFIYIDKGRLSVETDLDKFIMEKGEIYFHKPMEFHRHSAIQKHPASICIASFHSTDRVLEQLAQRRIQLPEHCRQLMTQLLKYGAMVFSSLIDDKENLYLVKNKEYPAYAEQMIQNYLEIFLMEVLALTDTSKAGQKIPLPGSSSKIQKNHSHELFTLAEQYLSNNLFASVTIADLCRHLNCSKTTLSVAFKSIAGISIIQYFNRLKIEKAKELIRLQNLNLTQIAELLNFCNISYFSNSFKSHTGMHPSEYARSIKANDCVRFLHSENGK